MLLCFDASAHPANVFQLPRSCHTFKCRSGNKEQTIYIVGTAHVSAASCDDVRAVIRAVKPEVVMLELCQERTQLLTVQKQDALTLPQAFAAWRTGASTPFQAAYCYLLGQIGDALEVMPGEEFRVALQEASKVDAKVLLGDRRLHITLARVWAALTAWEKTRLVWMFVHSGLTISQIKQELEDDIESLKETDAMTAAIKEMGIEFPALLAPLIYERDLFMVKQLRSLPPKWTRVVAVVGAGHLPGMRQHWDDDIDLEDICKVPENTPSRIKWGRLAATALLTGSCLYYGTVARRR
ncbi:hypothetical protein ABBQ38_013794 [Trebouxia sp. C0009 RCD-2024]